MRKEQVYEILKAEGQPMNSAQILTKMNLPIEKGNRLAVSMHLFNLKKAGRIVSEKWGTFKIAPVSTTNEDSVPKTE
jgi:hypothetical protein